MYKKEISIPRFTPKMHVPFNPQEIDWCLHLTPQTYNPYKQGGSGIFYGSSYQRGAGIGSLFRSLLRVLLPLGKEASWAVARQGLESGNRILSDVLQGKDLRESAKIQTRRGVINLLDNASANLKKNASKQKGEGLSTYKKATPKSIKRKLGLLNSHKNLYATVGPSKRKKALRKDLLGAY